MNNIYFHVDLSEFVLGFILHFIINSQLIILIRSMRNYFNSNTKNNFKVNRMSCYHNDKLLT